VAVSVPAVPALTVSAAAGAIEPAMAYTAAAAAVATAAVETDPTAPVQI